MDLLLDAGNSRLKAATRDSQGLNPLPPAVWLGDESIPDLASIWETVPRPDRILCANVAGAERGRAIESWSARLWRLPVQFVHAGEAAAGVRNRYGRPEQLGVDRWLAAVAGFNFARTSVCVIDCGTAVNVEFVTSAGDYLGGLIAPGSRLMAEALSRGTAALPIAELCLGDQIGRDTPSCIGSGVAHALGGLIDRVVATARRTLAAEPTWLITGGDASLLGALASVKFTEIPDLVLRGLALVQDGAP